MRGIEISEMSVCWVAGAGCAARAGCAAGAGCLPGAGLVGVGADGVAATDRLVGAGSVAGGAPNCIRRSVCARRGDDRLGKLSGV